MRLVGGAIPGNVVLALDGHLRLARCAVARRVAVGAPALAAMAKDDVAHVAADPEIDRAALAAAAVLGLPRAGLRRDFLADRLGIAGRFGKTRQPITADLVVVALGPG